MRAPCSVGRHTSMRVEEGRKRLKYSRDKNEGTYRCGKGVEEPAMLPGSELRVGRRERKRCAKIINGMSKKNKMKNHIMPGILCFIYTALCGRRMKKSFSTKKRSTACRISKNS